VHNRQKVQNCKTIEKFTLIDEYKIKKKQILENVSSEQILLIEAKKRKTKHFVRRSSTTNSVRGKTGSKQQPRVHVHIKPCCY